MKTIGVLSDTHLKTGDDFTLIRSIAEGPFADVDVVLHAGDIHDLAVMEAIFYPRPLHAVMGNLDSLLAMELPSLEMLDVENVHIALVHGHNYAYPIERSLASEFRNKNAVVFGHTHVPYCRKHTDVLLFNPGSPTQPRRGNPPSVGILRVEESVIEGHIVNLNRPGGRN